MAQLFSIDHILNYQLKQRRLVVYLINWVTLFFLKHYAKAWALYRVVVTKTNNFSLQISKTRRLLPIFVMLKSRASLHLLIVQVLVPSIQAYDKHPSIPLCFAHR